MKQIPKFLYKIERTNFKFAGTLHSRNELYNRFEMEAGYIVFHLVSQISFSQETALYIFFLLAFQITQITKILQIASII